MDGLKMVVSLMFDGWCWLLPGPLSPCMLSSSVSIHMAVSVLKKRRAETVWPFMTYPSVTSFIFFLVKASHRGNSDEVKK